MTEIAKEIKETFVDIKQTYVDERLREFFSVEEKPVNIDNICLFAAKTIEEYNSKAEKKLKGKQKMEAAVELAKSVIERSVAFVPDADRRQIVKNIFHNIDAIEQTIQFIVDISNNPNIVNFGKWVENTKRNLKNVVTGENEEKDSENKPKRGFFRRCFGCMCPPPNPEEEAEKEAVIADETTEPEIAKTEEVEITEEPKEAAAPSPAKKESKKEAKKRAEAEKLRKKLEELSMTPEQREERRKAEQEEKLKAEQEEKLKAEAEKKAEEQRKIEEAKELKRKAEEEKELKKRAEAAEKLRKKLEELSMTPEQREEKRKAEKEEKKKAEEEKKKKAEEEKIRKKLEKIEGGKKEEVSEVKTEEEQKEN